MATTQVDRSDTPLAALVHTAGSRQGVEIPIHSPVVRIGQGSQNDVTLDDDTVSTQHARLEFEGGSWQVTDLESKNGTYLDGVRLPSKTPTLLPEGAVVGFGAVKLEFRTVEGVDPAGARAAYQAPAERKPVAQRPTFRLPLWIVVLILLVLAVLVGILVISGGDPNAVQPAVEGLSQQLAVPPAAAGA